MSRLCLALLLPLLLLTGCAGVDKSRVEAQLAALETRAADLQRFIDTNAPLVAQLSAVADQTKDPQLQAAAARLAAAVATAQATLPEVQSALATSRTAVAQLEADAAGRVPWWSVAGGLLLTWAPRVLGLIPGLQPLAAMWANLHWAVAATRRQKDADAETMRI